MTYRTVTEERRSIHIPPTNHEGISLLRCSFHSVAITVHTWQQRNIPIPNNVAKELSSKLPSQIGFAASTQLGLKYGDCISHYRAVEIVLGEVLKVRRGYASGVIRCGDLCLHSRYKRHDDGTAERNKGGVINKHSWIDTLKE